jgi:tRNA-specific 2-thiouridylase
VVLDCVEAFACEVINPFVEEYRAGRTPNPCVVCNRTVKFGLLFDHARQMGAGRAATGHYARVEARAGRFALRRAADKRKDQSYVLAALSQDVVAHALFPLGEVRKEAVREKAHGLGLAAAERDESQEICFVPEDDYRRFLLERCGPPKPGPILSSKGEVLGEHQGLIYYTVGQRKGLGIAASRPYYVLELDPVHNAVVVGHEEETYCLHFAARDVNWCALAPQTERFDCLVQIRYLHTAAPATVTPAGDRLDVRFHEAQRAVTPGQWAVCYDADGYLLAGGVIDNFTIRRP